MSVRLVLLFIFSLNLSCTAVFNSNNLASMGLALSKYNDFAYFVDMDEPFSISSQGKLSAISLDFEFSCFFGQYSVPFGSSLDGSCIKQITVMVW